MMNIIAQTTGPSDQSVMTNISTPGYDTGEDSITESNWTSAAVADPLQLMRMICEVGISLPLAILGIIGNILAFVVLCRQKQRLTTNVLLQALAVADTLVLISSILLRSLRFIGWDAYIQVYDYIFMVLYPCVYIFRLAGMWITVMLTIDRYIAVCHPLHAQRLCTLTRTYITIAVLAVSTLVFSAPRFFEYRLINDQSGVGYVTTNLTKNVTYTVGYRIVCFFLVMYLIPMILLVVLNLRLICTLRRAYADRNSMISNGHIHNSKGMVPIQNISRSITVIVATVVVICVLCNVTAMTAHVLWALQTCFPWLQHLARDRRVIANASNVMVTFNCAVNFGIYCMFSRRFRSGLLQTCRCSSLRRLTQRWYTDYRRKSSGTSNTSYTSLALGYLRGNRHSNSPDGSRLPSN